MYFQMLLNSRRAHHGVTLLELVARLDPDRPGSRNKLEVVPGESRWIRQVLASNAELVRQIAPDEPNFQMVIELERPRCVKQGKAIDHAVTVKQSNWTRTCRTVHD